MIASGLELRSLATPEPAPPCAAIQDQVYHGIDLRAYAGEVYGVRRGNEQKGTRMGRHTAVGSPAWRDNVRPKADALTLRDFRLLTRSPGSVLSARAFPTIVAYAVSADAIGRGACAISADLGKDTDRGRALLAKMVGKVILRRDGDRLIGRLRATCPACWTWKGRNLSVAVVPGARL